MAENHTNLQAYNEKLANHSPYKFSYKEWKEILLRVVNQLGKDNLHIIAAGVGFYCFLAVFPTIIAIISIYGLFIEPDQVSNQIAKLGSILPSEAQTVIESRVTKLAETSSNTLGWSTFFSLLLALWSANVGIKALFLGINMAYKEKNKRSFIMYNLVSLLFTLGSIIIAIICMAFIVAFPAFAHKIGLGEPLATIIGWLRWLVLAFVVFGWFSLMYKFAPAKKHPSFKWVSIGALVATILWIIGSLGFSFYVSNFGNYDATYGSVSAVVILLFWLFLTNFIILLGAEINSEAENQV